MPSWWQTWEKAQQEAEADRVAAAKLADEARAIKEKHEELAADLARRRAEIMSKAGEEARALVKLAKAEAESAVKELREKIAAESTRARESAIKAARDKLHQLQHKVSRAVPEKVIAGQVPTVLRAGQEVLLPKFNQRGYVMNRPARGKKKCRCRSALLK